MSGVISLVVGVAVLGLIIYRQMSLRPVGANMRIMVILAAVGVVQFAQYLRTAHVSSGAVTADLAGSLALAVIFGLVRAMTVRLSFHDGQWWSRGTWLTILLWIAALGAHLGYDALVSGGGLKGGAFGSDTVLLYLAVTFGVQRLVVQARSLRAPVPGDPALTSTFAR